MLIIFTKGPMLDVWQGSKCISDSDDNVNPFQECHESCRW